MAEVAGTLGGHSTAEQLVAAGKVNTAGMLSGFEGPDTPSQSEMNQGSSVPPEQGLSNRGGPAETTHRFPINSQTLAGLALVAAMQLYQDKARKQCSLLPICTRTEMK